MANHKSALKRAKQNEERKLRNKAVRTRVRSAVKEVRSASPEAAAEALLAAQSTIDRAAKKGVLHRKNASRKISRLKKLVNTKSE
ncbi:MAG: 30S ribosomal protein S20 [Desulfobacterales bacterium]|nr:30S ribosomal protein S20 [Desulfobacterales bacterium]